MRLNRGRSRNLRGGGGRCDPFPGRRLSRKRRQHGCFRFIAHQDLSAGIIELTVQFTSSLRIFIAALQFLYYSPKHRLRLGNLGHRFLISRPIFSISQKYYPPKSLTVYRDNYNSPLRVRIVIPTKGDLCTTTVIPVKTGIQGWGGRCKQLGTCHAPDPFRPPIPRCPGLRKGLQRRESRNWRLQERCNSTYAILS